MQLMDADFAIERNEAEMVQSSKANGADQLQHLETFGSEKKIQTYYRMNQAEEAAGSESLHDQNSQEELFQPKNGLLFGNEDRQRNGNSEV